MPYLGGKITLGPVIAALLPDHQHYVEPYCGSLAVLLAKEPVHLETVNDIDRDLVTFWRVLRDRSGWVAPHRRAAAGMPWPVHWAVPTVADDSVQGVAACGLRLARELEWWRAGEYALRDATGSGRGLWQLCGGCLYWAGGLP